MNSISITNLSEAELDSLLNGEVTPEVESALRQWADQLSKKEKAPGKGGLIRQVEDLMVIVDIQDRMVHIMDRIESTTDKVKHLNPEELSMYDLIGSYITYQDVLYKRAQRACTMTNNSQLRKRIWEVTKAEMKKRSNERYFIMEVNKEAKALWATWKDLKAECTDVVNGRKFIWFKYFSLSQDDKDFILANLDDSTTVMAYLNGSLKRTDIDSQEDLYQMSGDIADILGDTHVAEMKEYTDSHARVANGDYDWHEEAKVKYSDEYVTQLLKS